MKKNKIFYKIVNKHKKTQFYEINTKKMTVKDRIEFETLDRKY